MRYPRDWLACLSHQRLLILGFGLLCHGLSKTLVMLFTFFLVAFRHAFTTNVDYTRDTPCLIAVLHIITLRHL